MITKEAARKTEGERSDGIDNIQDFVEMNGNILSVRTRLLLQHSVAQQSHKVNYPKYRDHVKQDTECVKVCFLVPANARSASAIASSMLLPSANFWCFDIAENLNSPESEVEDPSLVAA